MKFRIPLLLVLLLLVAEIVILFLTDNHQDANILSPLAKIDVKPIFSSKTSLDAPIHILLLGVDGRHGDKNPRCDAIHILSYYPKVNNLVITSIPRGTVVNVPEIEESSRYISNICHIMGIDYAISKIEDITALKVNYVVKIGFSQTLGILRLLKLPTTPTLQFLRNRQYGIGDYQRSHNQAIFVKDLLTTKFEAFMSLPPALQYFAYKTVETNISFENIMVILKQIQESRLYRNPENIILVTEPPPAHLARDIHYDADKYQNADSWQKDAEYKQYQADVTGYLFRLTQRADSYLEKKQCPLVLKLVTTPFEQQFWLQVEDEKLRYRYHTSLLKTYILCNKNTSEAVTLVRDYILELENNQIADQLTEAQSLLTQISK